MAASQQRLCFIICVFAVLLLVLFSRAFRDRRQEERNKREILDSTEIPAEHIDPAAIDLTPLVNTLINTSQSGSRQLFSLLSVTSYSSLALHKLTLLVYNISSIKSIENNKFRRRFCYCVTNETNDLTDFTAILLDVMGNSTSYLHELFKSASILSVSQRNNSDCIYICVMAGKMGREVPELWEVGSITPLFNQTIVEGPHRVGNVSSFRLPVEWHQLPTNLSHISPSGMSSMLTSRVHSTAHVSPTTMDEAAAAEAKITTAPPLATARQPATVIPQSQTTKRPETTTTGKTQRATTQEVTTQAEMTAQTTATEKPTSLQPITSTQPATTLQVTTASATTAAAPTPVRTPSTPERTPSTPVRTPSTPVRTPSTPERTPSTPVRTPSTPVRAPSTPVRAPSTATTAASTPVRAPSIPVSARQTPVQTSPTTERAPSTTGATPDPQRDPSTPTRAPTTPVTAPSVPVSALSTPVTAPSVPVSALSTPVTATSSTQLPAASSRPATTSPVISLSRLTATTHGPRTTTQRTTSAHHPGRLSPDRPTAGLTESRRTTGLLSRTTTSSKTMETEKPGCPWRRSEPSDASGSTTTVSAHKLQPCVLELCKFFSQCLCRPSSHKTRMKRYCDDSHLWYQKHTSEVCRRVRRVSFSRNLKQRCLTKMCNKL